MAAVAGMTGLVAGGCNYSNTYDTDTLVDRGVTVGDRVGGDAELWTLEKKAVGLESFWDGQPAVITFYRGGWCPYCNDELSAWAARADEVRGLGARLIAISPETPEKGAATQAKNDVGFEIYSDYDYQAARAFGLLFTVDDETQVRYGKYGIDVAASNVAGTWELPVPGTYIVDADGVVRYAYANEDYKVRADPDEVIGVLRGVVEAE